MTGRRLAPGQPEIGYIEPGHVPAGYLTERPPSPWGSRLVHWAATAAVLAAVVCLVGWPWPTLYALGLLAGASILLAGIRLLLTERREPPADDHTAGAPAKRCCVCGGTSTVYENCYGNWFCWPCADCPCGQIPCVRTGTNDPAVSTTAAADPDTSGRAPETARTHPDATEQQDTDQAGDHPDASGHHAGPGHAMLAALAAAISALPAPTPRHPDSAVRDRVAAALLARIKQATISGPQPLGTDPLTRFLAANEYDLADVVLAELAPELRAHADARTNGMRGAAALLRRTPRDSRDYPAVLTGARVIEAALDARPEA